MVAVQVQSLELRELAEVGGQLLESVVAQVHLYEVFQSAEEILCVCV